MAFNWGFGCGYNQSRGQAFTTPPFPQARWSLPSSFLLIELCFPPVPLKKPAPRPLSETQSAGLASPWYGACQGCCGQGFLAPRGGRAKRQAQAVSCRPRCRPRTRDTLGSQRPGGTRLLSAGLGHWAVPGLPAWSLLPSSLRGESSRPPDSGQGQTVSEASLTPSLGLVSGEQAAGDGRGSGRALSSNLRLPCRPQLCRGLITTVTHFKRDKLSLSLADP